MARLVRGSYQSSSATYQSSNLEKGNQYYMNKTGVPSLLTVGDIIAILLQPKVAPLHWARADRGYTRYGTTKHVPCHPRWRRYPMATLAPCR